MVNLNWLFADGASFGDLCSILGDINDENLFSNPFISSIVDAYWELFRSGIYIEIVMPSVIYAISLIIYFSSYMKIMTTSESYSDFVDTPQILITVVMILSGLWLIYVEAQ